MCVKKFWASALLLCLSLASQGESILQCEKKTNKDAQYLCTASVMVNPVVCDQISSKDGVFYCRAMVASNSYGCDKIESPGKRQSCLMAVRDKQRGSIWANKTMN